MKLSLVCILFVLSACSTLTANREDRLKGHSFSGVTNNFSAWYCGSADLVKETENMGIGQPIVFIFAYPLILISNTLDLVFSASSDVILLPYTLITDSENERSDISDCSTGVWTN